MATEGVLIQVHTYPRKKGESRSIIIKGESHSLVYARIKQLYSELATKEQVTITHIK